MCSKDAGDLIDVMHRSGTHLKDDYRFKYLGSVMCEGGGCEEDVKGESGRRCQV